MFKKLICTSIALCMLLSFLPAQTNDEKAKSAFVDGQSLLQAGKPSDAIMAFDEAVSLLGSTNIRIQPLLIRALVEIKDYRRAQEEIETYFKLNPNPAYVDYADITATKATVDKLLAGEDTAYKAAISQDGDEGYAGYLAAYPLGLHAAEVSEKRDDAAFARASDSGTVDAMRAYLAAYPNGRHAGEAQASCAALDEALFGEAVAMNTPEAWGSYLVAFPHGTHLEEARTSLAISTEDTVFAATVGAAEDAPYASYLSQYPSGRYAGQTKTARDDAAYARLTKSGTWAAFWNYKDVYPDGKHVGEANSQLQRLEDAAFAAAQAKGSPQAWEAFIKEYSRGGRTEEAKKKLAEAKEYALYSLTLNQTADKPFADYLAVYPNGTYSKDAKFARDLKAYSRAVDEYTWESVWEYIDAYPSGYCFENAMSEIKSSDDEVYSDACISNTIDAYQKYIQYYARGFHIAEAENRLNVLLQEKAAKEKLEQIQNLEWNIKTYSSKAAGKYLLGGLEFTGAIGLSLIAINSISNMFGGTSSTSDYLLLGAAAGFIPFLFQWSFTAFDDGYRYASNVKEYKEQLSHLSLLVTTSGFDGVDPHMSYKIGMAYKLPIGRQ
ncbi:MAG: hypothetical protein PHH86_09110 [Sphaerochaetaceae bacterium]|nr:hypothetical protein [Sphaerochaetaceae bacterium]